MSFNELDSLMMQADIANQEARERGGVSKEIVSVSETIYGFSHYYTVFYEDGSWEHIFYYRAEFEPFIEEGK